jgi:hypothetical protein
MVENVNSHNNVECFILKRQALAVVSRYRDRGSGPYNDVGTDEFVFRKGLLKFLGQVAVPAAYIQDRQRPVRGQTW